MMNNATTERTALRRKTRVALSLAAFLLFHFLVSPVWCQNGATVIVTVAKSTPEFTRKSEGDVIELDDGRLLLVYMEFSGTGSDFAKTRLVAQESSDGGRTWGRHRVITETTPGDMNVYSPNLIRARQRNPASLHAAASRRLAAIILVNARRQHIPVG